MLGGISHASILAHCSGGHGQPGESQTAAQNHQSFPDRPVHFVKVVVRRHPDIHTSYVRQLLNRLLFVTNRPIRHMVRHRAPIQ